MEKAGKERTITNRWTWQGYTPPQHLHTRSPPSTPAPRSPPHSPPHPPAPPGLQSPPFPRAGGTVFGEPVPVPSVSRGWRQSRRRQWVRIWVVSVLRGKGRVWEARVRKWSSSTYKAGWKGKRAGVRNGGREWRGRGAGVGITERSEDSQVRVLPWGST